MNAVSFLDFNDAAPQGWLQPAASLDREAILSRAKMQLEPLLQMLFPHGKRRGREFVVGNLQGEPGDSLCVALEGARAGMWIDHATGAAVIVSHHFAKREASTPEQAREAIRGTGGLVDGVRCVYAIWLPKEDHAKSICEKLGIAYQRNLVVQGGVVKANGRANLQVSTYIRSDSGLLVDQTYRLRHDPLDHASLLLQLRAAIAHAALEGFPYTKTAGNGVYERRFELPEPLNGLSKHRLVSMVDELLQGGQLVQAVAEGSKVAKWLDVPTGPLAQGDGDFEEGHLTPVHALQEPLQ